MELRHPYIWIRFLQEPEKLAAIFVELAGATGCEVQAYALVRSGRTRTGDQGRFALYSFYSEALPLSYVPHIDLFGGPNLDRKVIVPLSTTYRVLLPKPRDTRTNG